MKRLKQLYILLKKIGFSKEAQEVEELSEWDEPWHEEVVKELEDEQIDDLEKNSPIFKLDEYYEGDYPEYIKLAKEYGVTISPKIKDSDGTFDDSPFLGSGAYGVVLSGVYKGKEVAVKFSNSREDAENWQTIYQSMNSYSPEVKRYIPEVYIAEAIPKDMSKDYYGLEYAESIVVMERLLPINFANLKIRTEYNKPTKTHYTLEEVGVGGDFNQGAKIPKQIKYDLQKMYAPYMWERDTERAINNLHNIYPGYRGKDSETKKAIKAGIRSLEPLTVEEWQEISEEHEVSYINRAHVENDLQDDFSRQITFKNDFSQYPSKLREIIKYIAYYISGIVVSEIMDAIVEQESERGGFMPSSYEGPDDRDDLGYLNFLHNSLNELSKSTGLGWNDLHSGNVMISPKDNGIKIIDVGLYDYVGKNSPEFKQI